MPSDTLPALLDKCDAQKNEILARVGALSDTARNARPQPGEWSPHEIVAHLVVADELAASQITAAERAGGALGRPGIRGALFVALIAPPMRAGRRLPAPDIVLPDVLAPLPFPVLAERWETARQAVRVRIAAVTPEGENEAVALHPYAGPLSARQFMVISNAHLTYHQKQIARLAAQTV